MEVLEGTLVPYKIVGVALGSLIRSQRGLLVTSQGLFRQRKPSSWVAVAKKENWQGEVFICIAMTADERDLF